MRLVLRCGKVVSGQTSRVLSSLNPKLTARPKHYSLLLLEKFYGNDAAICATGKGKWEGRRACGSV